MTRTHAGRAALAVLALAGLGACTTISGEPAYYRSAGVAPGHYGYGATPGRYGVPDYAAAAAAGDTYCQEATAAVRQAESAAAYSGSPGAYARMERARGYASRDC
ncbi:MAG: hypothetical protein IRZ13_04805 [Acetobacteraceae bacterium]|nr:hypothetical protein [Acetobacteraceae bacterium]